MTELISTCQCGAKVRLSEFALGMRMKCRRCGAVYTVSAENLTPVGQTRPGDGQAESETQQRDTSPSISRKNSNEIKLCARCGKPFRGDWDRFTTNIGVVCLICSRLAAEEGPVARVIPPEPYVPPPTPDPVARRAQEMLEKQQNSLPARFERFRQTRQFRFGLIIASIGVITAAIYYSLIASYEEPVAPPRIQQTARPDQADEGLDWMRMGIGLMGPPDRLTRGQNLGIAAFVWSAAFLLGLLPTFLAIMITHVWPGGSMPGNNWWTGALHILAMAVLVTALYCIPFVGWLIALYLLHETYNFGFLECLEVAFLRFVFSLFTYPLTLLVFGALGLLLF